MKFPEQFRRTLHPLYASQRGDDFGTFIIPHKCDLLCCIASSGSDPMEGLAPWEHVSVTVRNRKGDPVRRCATWEQMSAVKSLFWDDSEAVVQFHPPKSDHINMHEFCLHLWRPVKDALPLPPSIYVGVKTEKPMALR